MESGRLGLRLLEKLISWIFWGYLFNVASCYKILIFRFSTVYLQVYKVELCLFYFLWNIYLSFQHVDIFPSVSISSKSLSFGFLVCVCILDYSFIYPNMQAVQLDNSKLMLLLPKLNHNKKSSNEKKIKCYFIMAFVM